MEQSQSPTLLRLITCGGVDDGKSTLIGRLLSEPKLLYEDQAAALQHDGTQGTNLDFALFVDGLQAEREQGITNDVADRFFAAGRRRFVVADTPGHEHYTRSMATVAPGAQLAVLLIDARKGLSAQAKRHSRIVSLLGIKHMAVAVNKMDLVEWDNAAYAAIEWQYRRFAADFGIEHTQFIPLSALHGDNVVEPSLRMPWYAGPTLLRFLETVEVPPGGGSAFRLPVQYVSQPKPDFRGYCGRVAGGSVRTGDRIRVVPSGAETTVRSIVTFDGEMPMAREGQSVTLHLSDEVDVSPGDVICAASDPTEVADQFEAHLLWMSGSALIPGRIYTAKIHARHVGATISHIKYRIDVDSGAHLAATTLGLNDIAVVNLSFDTPVPFDAYVKNRAMGSFILIDRLTKDTVGGGLIHFALRRALNVHWQAIDIGPAHRASLKSQRAGCFWFTGLSGSGKSTIANLLDKRLHAAGKHTFLLDGDNVRHGLNRDLGFTEADRVENIRRVAEVARLMVDAGLIVIVALISPFRADRDYARSLFRENEFVEVFVDTPLEVCESRDTKGLYAKARAGLITNFTGFDSPYETPQDPEVRLKTTELGAVDAAEHLAQLALAG